MSFDTENKLNVRCKRCHAGAVTMTLAEFTQAMHNQVDKFQREWIAKNKDQGDDRYSLEMPEEEWDEQFIAWMELQEL